MKKRIKNGFGIVRYVNGDEFDGEFKNNRNCDGLHTKALTGEITVEKREGT